MAAPETCIKHFQKFEIERPAQDVICHELQKFYGRNAEVKIRCKTSGSP